MIDFCLNLWYNYNTNSVVVCSIATFSAIQEGYYIGTGREIVQFDKFQFVEEKHMKKNIEVYRDERFILGWEDNIPYLKVCGEKYILTGQPYEPCLYITDESGQLTVVHNSFYAYDVLDLFYD